MDSLPPPLAEARRDPKRDDTTPLPRLLWLAQTPMDLRRTKLGVPDRISDSGEGADGSMRLLGRMLALMRRLERPASVGEIPLGMPSAVALLA